MATMSELNAEYQLLKATHERLVEERATLEREAADGAAFQDLAHRTRRYINELDTYTVKLQTRRRELNRQPVR